MSGIIEDKPLSSLDQDEFGREPLAEMIADSIESVCKSNHGCIVYGIYGKWGEGKTTLMNFVESKLLGYGKKDDILISHFNPWLLDNEEALLKDFFSTICLNCDEKLKKAIRKYGNLVSFASKTILNAIIPSVGVAVSSFINGVKKAFDGLDDTIAEQKKKVSKAIESSGKHCLVFIDDIDRLDKDELHTVFRLIRQVADFSNTIYVVAMDVDITSKSLGQFFGKGNEDDGRKFIDKIVQVPIVLPTIHEKWLRVALSRELSSVLGTYGYDMERIPHLLDTIGPLFTSRRDIVRYINQLSFVLPSIVSEVNIEDLCALEAIKVRNPLAFNLIRENRQGLLKHSSSVAAILDKEKASAEQKENFEKAVGTICNCFDKSEGMAIRHVLDYLFGHSEYDYTTLIDNRHIQSDVFFSLYFIQAVPEDILPYKKIASLKSNLLTWTTTYIVEWINECYGVYGENEVLRAVLEIIRTGDAHKMSERSSILIKALSFSVMAQGYGYNSISNPTGVAITISSVILNRYMYLPLASPGAEPVRDSKAIADTLSTIFSDAELNFCMAVIANDISPFYSLIPEDEGRCVKILTDRFEDLPHAIQLKYSKFELNNLFSHWARRDRTSLDKYVVSLIEDEEIDYLSVISHFIDGEHDNKDVSNFVLFFEAALPMLNKRIENDKRPDSDTKERRLYLSNYKTILQNYGRASS